MTKPRDIEVLEALFVGDEPDREDVLRAASAAADDAEVRDVYNRLAIADEELGGEFERAVGEALFASALDEMLADERATQDTTPDNVVVLGERGETRQPTGAWLAAAALLAMTLGAVASEKVATDAPEFQARSAVVAEEPRYETPSLEVFCVERDGGEIRFTGQRESEFATVRCPLDAEVKFAVRNTDPAIRYAAFFGIARDNTLYWYGPSPAAKGAVAIESSSELQSVGETIRLDVNHSPGTVKVVGLFAESPLTWSDVRGWIGIHSRSVRDGTPVLEDGMMIRQTFEVNEP